MLTKIVIILFLFVIIYCLGSGLYYLIRGDSTSGKMVKALTWRIGLSILLFVLLLLGVMFGVIQPHRMERTPITNTNATQP
jgi:hypothetical protein